MRSTAVVGAEEDSNAYVEWSIHSKETIATRGVVVAARANFLGSVVAASVDTVGKEMPFYYRYQQY